MCRLRDEIDRILARDQAGRLIVAIETALDDKRYEVRPDSIRVCVLALFAEGFSCSEI